MQQNVSQLSSIRVQRVSYKIQDASEYVLKYKVHETKLFRVCIQQMHYYLALQER